MSPRSLPKILIATALALYDIPSFGYTKTIKLVSSTAKIQRIQIVDILTHLKKHNIAVTKSAIKQKLNFINNLQKYQIELCLDKFTKNIGLKNITWEYRDINKLKKDNTIVAVIGTRKNTVYGETLTRKIIRFLVENEFVVATGMARGIDNVAFEETRINKGICLMVLPYLNLKQIMHYVNKHKKVYAAGIYAASSKIHKGLFLDRNMLLAALSDIVIVTEAPLKSGALHAASFAQKLGKKVIACPGSVLSPTSWGTNKLFLQAKSTYSIDKIFNILGTYKKLNKKEHKTQNNVEQAITTAILSGITSPMSLAQKLHMDENILRQQLTILEIKGILRVNKFGEVILL